MDREVKKLVKARGIKHLLHFTRLDNLDSILQYGLISRQRIAELGLSSDFNDDYRMDGQEDSISCSVEFPNYKMFYKLRMANPTVDWVVIALKSSVMWRKDCAFCATNAASNDVTGIPIENRMGESAFESMFDEVDGKPERSKMQLSDRAPSDPQAEVLVFGGIETEYIAAVVPEKEAIKDRLSKRHPDIGFQLYSYFFNARIDYQHW